MFIVLNMRSGASSSDLTARARIRDAAVLRYAVDGFGAPLRLIAADAGVSAALVIHHFGSKDALRRECDEHVLGLIREAKHEGIDDVASGKGFLERFATADRFAPLVGYVLRSLQDGGPVARGFVQHMLDDADAYVGAAVAAGVAVPSRDEKARVRFLTLSSLGALLLSITLDPPSDPSDLTAYLRRFFDEMTLPMLELYAEGFLTTPRMLEDYLLYVPDAPTGDGPERRPA